MPVRYPSGPRCAGGLVTPRSHSRLAALEQGDLNVVPVLDQLATMERQLADECAALRYLRSAADALPTLARPHGASMSAAVMPSLFSMTVCRSR